MTKDEFFMKWKFELRKLKYAEFKADLDSITDISKQYINKDELRDWQGRP